MKSFIKYTLKSMPGGLLSASAAAILNDTVKGFVLVIVEVKFAEGAWLTASCDGPPVFLEQPVFSINHKNILIGRIIFHYTIIEEFSRDFRDTPGNKIALPLFIAKQL
ncbi:MAG: hypothetical protein ABIQ31_18065 [Ferruginibacter sp.]